ncbi:hypothetical protein [Candidatus Tisiphia endosymbiont of Sialis lutaria]|uniref:hypothetical protein n=1 Tax=Candidatus Tisiphia endosymbiont of Sialis lutaria TaxID=2029164 RepID=UPI00312C846E
MKDEKPYNFKITILLSISLLNKLKDIIISNKNANNYKYVDVSDIVRTALTAYKNGMTLNTQDIKDKKKYYSFNLSQELYDFCLTLPKRAKSEIIAKAVGTYIQLDSF